MWTNPLREIHPGASYSLPCDTSARPVVDLLLLLSTTAISVAPSIVCFLRCSPQSSASLPSLPSSAFQRSLCGGWLADCLSRLSSSDCNPTQPRGVFSRQQKLTLFPRGSRPCIRAAALLTRNCSSAFPRPKAAGYGKWLRLTDTISSFPPIPPSKAPESLVQEPQHLSRTLVLETLAACTVPTSPIGRCGLGKVRQPRWLADIYPSHK